jgi:hypothetical protein
MTLLLTKILDLRDATYVIAFPSMRSATTAAATTHEEYVRALNALRDGLRADMLAYESVLDGEIARLLQQAVASLSVGGNHAESAKRITMWELRAASQCLDRMWMLVEMKETLRQLP